MDPVAAQVVVQVDPTVTGAKLGQLEAAVAGSSGAARIERLPGRLSLNISGGDAIYGGGYRCSLGFNAQRQHLLLPDCGPLPTWPPPGSPTPP